MSDPNDFLSRWSRRKRAVAEADAPKPPHRDADATAPEGDARPEPTAPPPSEAPPAFDPASLPPIESITAATDIRDFLKPGVPAELARAALRRAWSADPAIRDFVGLSENSWDFNAPGAMGGFGPLEMTDDLRRMVEKLFTPSLEASAPATAKARQLPENAMPIPPAKEADSVTAMQDKIANRQEELLDTNQLAENEGDTAAVQRQPAERDRPQSTGWRGHGSALPK
jgi:hypothetical protein